MHTQGTGRHGCLGLYPEVQCSAEMQPQISHVTDTVLKGLRVHPGLILKATLEGNGSLSATT